MDSAKNCVSVIVPCFNEGSRIIPVISEILKSEYVKEIIVVDDGSKEETKKILSQIKGIKVFHHQKNMGKSQALKTGFSHSTAPIITFIDSDLKNFSENNLNKLLEPIVFDNYDMVIGARKHAPVHTTIIGFEDAYTGQRAIKKSILLEKPFVFDQKSYLFEAELNRIAFGNIRIAKVVFDDLSQYSKREKYGFIGLLSEFRMLFDIIFYLGLLVFFYQMFFAKKLPRINS